MVMCCIASARGIGHENNLTGASQARESRDRRMMSRSTQPSMVADLRGWRDHLWPRAHPSDFAPEEACVGETARKISRLDVTERGKVHTAGVEAHAGSRESSWNGGHGGTSHGRENSLVLAHERAEPWRVALRWRLVVTGQA